MSAFSDAERAAVYRAIAERRDVRSNFTTEDVPDDVLARILAAGHMAPSVGFSQPWRFIVARDPATRRAVRASFLGESERVANAYDDDRATAYRTLRLEGLETAPLGICVISDERPETGHGLGRRSMPETARYSTVCAIANMWLAARAEGVGVGWVSILDPSDLRALFGVPERFAIVAYLCLGYVDAFADRPDLERAGWERRLPLADVVSYERFESRAS